MEEFLQADESLFLWLNNLGNSNFDAFWQLISNKLIWIPLYATFLYILYKNFSLKSLGYILFFIVLGVTISDQLSTIFKEGIGRLRPCYDEDLKKMMRKLECGGSFSFYSAHASNSFFIAEFLVILLLKKYGKVVYSLLIWAAIVSYSRIYLGVHYPYDVVMGALVGFLLGGFFGTLTQKVLYNKQIFR